MFSDAARLYRPMPPRSLSHADEHGTFERALEVEEWIVDTFLDPDSPLYDVEHQHLREARIGVLWSNIPAKRRGVTLAGTASMAKPPSGLSGYDRQMYLWVIRSFFGIEPLNFLITFDAAYASYCTHVNWLALAKHEVCHCGQAKDEDGELIYTGKDFRPVFTMKAHDVEEHISVVRDFGAVGPNVKELVEAANAEPRIAQAHIDWACGTRLCMAA